MSRYNASMKKSVVFIVEGNTDKRALENIFRSIYKNKDVIFKFTNGDITSNNEIDKRNVEDKIYDIVSKYMLQNKLTSSDIWEIVQIFDTDGTYIPDSAIIEGQTQYFLYSKTQISCKNRQRIVERNVKKREMMDYLLSKSDIKGIPYSKYYMSSNLDHALYNEQNLSDDEKSEYSDDFYSSFVEHEKLFVDYLYDDVVNGVPNTMLASWRYIKEDLHSLERHTNLHIYFKLNPYD